MRKSLLMIMLCFLLALAGCTFSGVMNSTDLQTHPSTQKLNAQKKNRNESISNSPWKMNITSWIHEKTPVRFPILMYHSISSGGNSLHVPAEEFRAQMKWIKDHHYTTLTPEEAYQMLTKNIRPQSKCVLITLDDGFRDSYQTALPILKNDGLHATVFMIGKSIGKHNHLTRSELIQMNGNVISIQSHTIHHLELSQLTLAEQKSELVRSKALFDRLLHQNTMVISYPAGRYNSETLKLDRQAGYKMAVTTEPGAATKSQGLFALHRIRIVPGMSLSGFGNILNSANKP